MSDPAWPAENSLLVHLIVHQPEIILDPRWFVNDIRALLRLSACSKKLRQIIRHQHVRIWHDICKMRFVRVRSFMSGSLITRDEREHDNLKVDTDLLLNALRDEGKLASNKFKVVKNLKIDAPKTSFFIYRPLLPALSNHYFVCFHFEDDHCELMVRPLDDSEPLRVPLPFKLTAGDHELHGLPDDHLLVVCSVADEGKEKRVRLAACDLKARPITLRHIVPETTSAAGLRFVPLPTHFLARSSFVFGLVNVIDHNFSVVSICDSLNEPKQIVHMSFPHLGQACGKPALAYQLSAVGNAPAAESQLYCVISGAAFVILNSRGELLIRDTFTGDHLGCSFVDESSMNLYFLNPVLQMNHRSEIRKYLLPDGEISAPLSAPSQICVANEFSNCCRQIFDSGNTRRPLILHGLTTGTLEILDPEAVEEKRATFGLRGPLAKVLKSVRPPNGCKRVNRIQLHGRFALIAPDSTIALYDWIKQEFLWHRPVHRNGHRDDNTVCNVGWSSDGATLFAQLWSGDLILLSVHDA